MAAFAACRQFRRDDPRPGRLEKTKVRLDTASAHDDAAGWAELPDAFRELVNRSLSLQGRVRRLDEEIYGGNVRHLTAAAREGSPVSDQILLLKTVFARG